MAETRRLVLLRHGRTAWNSERRAQGHADTSLDDDGMEQARRAAASIAPLRPARLWSSDLARARQTAEAVSATTGLAAQVDDRLREFAVGEREGLTRAEARVRFPWIDTSRGFLEQLAEVPGAEAVTAVASRMRAALLACAADLGVGEVGVVVSHGGSLRVGVAAVLGWPDSAMLTLAPLGNCAGAVLDVASRPGEGPVTRLAAYGVSDFAATEGIG